MSTSRSLHLSIPDLDQPDLWDRRLNTTDHLPLLIQELRHDTTALGRRRLQQAVNASGDTLDVLNTLQSVRAQGISGLEGVCARALAALGRWSEVLTSPRAKGESSHPLELENVLDDEHAQTIACIELKDYSRAERHLHAVVMLSKALGMRYRLQWALIEGGRLSMHRGKSQPEQIIHARMMLPMSNRRELWSAQALAEAQMAEGDYHSAWMSVQDHPSEDVEHLPLFLAAVLNLSAFRAACEDAQGGYAPLARAIWSLRSGKPVDPRSLGTPQHDPILSYVEVLNALLLSGSPQSAVAKRGRAQLERLIGTVATPELRFILQFALTGLAVEGREPGAYGAFEGLLSDLQSLPYPIALLELFCDIAPQRAALLMFSPRALTQQAELFFHLESKMPLLVGGRLRLSGNLIVLPDRVHGGRQILRAAMLSERFTASTRTRQAISKLLHEKNVPHYANLGAVISAYRLFLDQMPHELWEGWISALHEVIDLLDSPALQKEARLLVPHVKSVHTRGGDPCL